MSNNEDINSLSHSKWRCHYHVVFAPKYRRKAIYGKIKTDIGKILPRRVTGTCAMHQRAVAKAIKRARVVAILPFDADQ